MLLPYGQRRKGGGGGGGGGGHLCTLDICLVCICDTAHNIFTLNPYPVDSINICF